MMRLKLFFFCLMPVLQLNAQNSGFMGKKFMISAALQTNTNELILNDHNTDIKSPVKYYLDLKSSFAAAYSISRRLMLGVDFNSNKLGHIAQFEGNDPWGYYNTEGYKEVQLKTMLLGLNLKVFPKNSTFAPIGTYFEYQLGMLRYQMIDENGLVGPPNRLLKEDQGYYIGYGIGRQQMLLKYLSLNVGVDFKISSFILKAVEDDLRYEYQQPSGDQVVLRPDPAIKMLYSYSFNAKIGLGLLLF